MSAARRLWLARALAASLALAPLAVSILVGLIVWDGRTASLAADSPVAGPAFTREGSRYIVAHPEMVRQSFSAAKAPQEFRVFVLGSSEAMGTPYVHQNLNLLSGRLLGMPNEGGISTWLTRYLERLLPGRPITVVNAAKGGRSLKHAVVTMVEVLAVGQPDLIVLLEGNNEHAVPEVDPQLALRPGADLGRVLTALTRDFERQLAEVARLAKKSGIPTYVLTVPNNLRDWQPTGGAAAHWMARGAHLEARGELKAARDAYLKAKDLDETFLRTRSAWNDRIRGLRSPSIRVLDLERLMFARAFRGIPGNDLFHDYCHLTLAGNRLAAFEIARRIRTDLHLTAPLSLEDADLRLFAARQLRLLYWIKAFKWARSSLAGDLSPTHWANFNSAAAGYLREAEQIDTQARLFSEGKL